MSSPSCSVASSPVTARVRSARRRDLFNGWVHRLIEAWAKPEVKNEVLVYAAAPE